VRAKERKKSTISIPKKAHFLKEGTQRKDRKGTEDTGTEDDIKLRGGGGSRKAVREKKVLRTT